MGGGACLSGGVLSLGIWMGEAGCGCLCLPLCPPLCPNPSSGPRTHGACVLARMRVAGIAAAVAGTELAAAGLPWPPPPATRGGGTKVPTGEGSALGCSGGSGSDGSRRGGSDRGSNDSSGSGVGSSGSGASGAQSSPLHSLCCGHPTDATGAYAPVLPPPLPARSFLCVRVLPPYFTPPPCPLPLGPLSRRRQDAGGAGAAVLPGPHQGALCPVSGTCDILTPAGVSPTAAAAFCTSGGARIPSHPPRYPA